LSADTIVPGYANPQNLNRYSYVTNNPLRYTDPTGHMLSAGEGSITQQTLNDDARRDKDFKNTTERNACRAGQKIHCSYARNHPVQTVAFVGGGLLLAGAGAAATSYMSAANSAAAINAGISALGDCISTGLGGGKCTAKSAAISAGFSLGMGQLGGIATEMIGTKTVGRMFGVLGATTAIQIGGNTLQRWVKGEPTNSNEFLMDEAAGGVAGLIQMVPDTNVYVLSHVAEAVTSAMSAAGTFNPNPSITLIPGQQ
jgi:hypothetical protein